MLDHFLKAQDRVYQTVLDELRDGRKRSHWMWFIFPQLIGLGQSLTAARYGIADLSHAKAYADHGVLGLRLRECVNLANAVEGRTARQLFGYPDDLKFRSSLTLFLMATEEETFRHGLEKYYKGKLDPLTTDQIAEN